MSVTGPASAPARTTFWVAALLLLATALAHLQLSRCIGDCGARPAGHGASCCTAAADGPATCCGCCEPADDVALVEPGNLVQLGNADLEPAPNGSVRGSCAPGCRLTTTFEGVEFAPAPAGVQLTDGGPVAFVPLSTTWPTPDRRPLTRGRPFDRGPPRVDAGTALRACTVLLI